MKAVYPGSFDPITKGHVDIIERASKFCGELVVLVLTNARKETFFSIDEKVVLVKMAVSHLPNVYVQRHDSLTAEFAKEYGANAIVRGVRNMTDFDFESNISIVNGKLVKDLETILLISKPELKHVSSNAVKELASYGADLSEYIPDSIRDEIVNELRHGR